MAEATDKLSAEPRTKFGKGAARKIRAADNIPAVIYGHGTDPRHVTLPGHATMLLVRKANAVIELDIAGDSQLVLVKDVQRDPVRQIIEHIDLIVVRKGERVEVEVAVHTEGESAPETIASVETPNVLLSAEATHIPERIVVDVEGLEEGTQILAKDLQLPRGAQLVTDEEQLIVNITVPQLDLTSDAETESEEDEEGESAEGEKSEGDEKGDSEGDKSEE